MAFDPHAAAAYVLSRQCADGGYGFYRTPEWGVDESNAPDTRAALETLQALGYEPPRPAQTATYLRGLQEGDGSFPTVVIGEAALAGLEALGALPARSPEKWALAMADRTLLRHAPPTRDVLVSARRAVALLARCGIALGAGHRAEIASLLAALAVPGGGWAAPGADLEATADAVALGLAAGVAVADAALSLLQACEDPRLGYRRAPHTTGAPVTTLSAGAWLTDALGVAVAYPEALQRNIALLQRPNGGFAANHFGLPTLQDTWRAVMTVRLAEPTAVRGARDVVH